MNLNQDLSYHKLIIQSTGSRGLSRIYCFETLMGFRRHFWNIATWDVMLSCMNTFLMCEKYLMEWNANMSEKLLILFFHHFPAYWTKLKLRPIRLWSDIVRAYLIPKNAPDSYIYTICFTYAKMGKLTYIVRKNNCRDSIAYRLLLVPIYSWNGFLINFFNLVHFCILYSWNLPSIWCIFAFYTVETYLIVSINMPIIFLLKFANQYSSYSTQWDE